MVNIFAESICIDCFRSLGMMSFCHWQQCCFRFQMQASHHASMNWAVSCDWLMRCLHKVFRRNKVPTECRLLEMTLINFQFW